MPRYLTLFKYSEQGAKGFMKEKAAARESAARKAMESSGGRLEAVYWVPTGEYSGVMIAELPDAAAVAAGTAFLYSTGFFSEYRSIELLTASEIDAALGKSIAYRPPGGG